ALSGYLPRPEVWQPPRTDLGGMPVLVTHGTYDSILPVAWGRAAAERLRQYNADVRYEEFPMDHEVNTACLEVIRGWLAARVTGEVGQPGSAVAPPVPPGSQDRGLRHRPRQRGAPGAGPVRGRQVDAAQGLGPLPRPLFRPAAGGV